MNLLQRILQRVRAVPSVTWEALPSFLRERWPLLSAGSRFRFRCEAAIHEVAAVLTSQGWLLDDHQACVFTIAKPPGGLLNPVEPEWSSERSQWEGQSSGATPRKLSSTPLTSASQRRCHVFGVGIAKSGTTSLAGLFSRYHLAHEFEAAATIRHVSSQSEVPDLLARDVRSGFLECDSSQLHFWYLEELVRTFPAARFVLTIREPRAWLDSWINHRLSRGMSPDWWPIEEERFGPRCGDDKGPERLLAELGLPSLEGALGFWRRHHERVIQSVPPRRLLVVRLERLTTETARVARFAGVAEDSLTPESAFQNNARARFHVLDRLPLDHLDSVQEQICGHLWRNLCQLSDHA